MGILDFFTGKSKRSGGQLTYDDGIKAGLIHRDSISTSNMVVSEYTAFGVTAIKTAVQVISEAIGSFPLTLYKDTDQGREKDKNHPYYTLLHDSPNPEVTRNVLWETVMKNALLYGTGYLELERNKAGEVINMWILHPVHVTPWRTPENNYKLQYRVHTRNANEVFLDPSELIVIPGIGDDGSYGYDLLRLCRDAIGFSISCNRAGEAFFANGCRLSGTLNVPSGKLSPEVKVQTKKDWDEHFSGVKNIGQTPILDQGMTYNPLTFTNEAGLYTETRTFQITEVSRLFNINPTKLHELGRATWANLSTLNEDFYITTLRPWIEKIESELEKKLQLYTTENYCEFNVDAILRGDITTRYTAYKTAIEAGFMTQDEVRELENLPKLPPAMKIPPQIGATANGNTLSDQSMDE